MLDILDIRKKLLEGQGLTAVRAPFVLSYLIPALEKGLQTERAFVLRGGASPKPTAGRPFAHISVLSQNGQLLTYKHCAVEDFMDPALYPLTAEYQKALPTPRSVEAHKRLELEYIEVYRKLRTFAFAETPNEEQRACMAAFDRLLAQLVPAGLLPYYYGLSPAFFAWLRQN